MIQNNISDIDLRYIQKNNAGLNRILEKLPDSSKLNLIEYMRREVTIENLLKNKGFADAYVVNTDNAVNVTVNKEELTYVDVAQVVDIVCR